MLHKHRACVVAKQGGFHSAGEVGCGGEVGVVVGGAEHPTLGCHRVGPLLGLIVAAVLEGVAHLHLKDVGDTQFQLCVKTLHLRSSGIVAGLDDVASLILTSLCKREYIVKDGVETLQQEVCLQRAEVVVEVSRGAEAV